MMTIRVDSSFGKGRGRLSSFTEKHGDWVAIRVDIGQLITLFVIISDKTLEIFKVEAKTTVFRHLQLVTLR